MVPYSAVQRLYSMRDDRQQQVEILPDRIGVSGKVDDQALPADTCYSSYYDPTSNTLTLTGNNMNTILSPSETNASDVKGHLDWSKLVWDINGDGATTANVGFDTSKITSATVLDDHTLKIVLTDAQASTLEKTTGYGITGGADAINISTGFSLDAAGNIGTPADALGISLLGTFNQPVTPHAYSIDLTSATVSATVVNEDTGVDTLSSSVAFTAKDLMFIGGTSASVLTVGNASAGLDTTLSHGTDKLTLTGFHDSLDASKVLFDDGTLLKLNTGGSTILTGGNSTGLGGTGGDQLIAGASGDTLFGYGGNDLLLGGIGNDVINGGRGNDMITGGKGNDYLTGGTGVDTFTYSATPGDNGYDIISDFTAGDTIQITGMTFAPSNTWIADHVVQSGASDLVIVLDSQDSIRLIGANAEDLVGHITDTTGNKAL